MIGDAMTCANCVALLDALASERERVNALQVQLFQAGEAIVAAEARADALRVALEEIAAKSCGVWGHSVATDCGARRVARAALDSADGGRR